ncbi:MAG TPA: hypothetical protein P5099_03965 [Candidatus Moranbacteria bacterium]|nr:hypothetical protein [Candidatus Moranbacteria bacterium]HSA08499.1 hypothetical protein [Candidatus Moranbacteria bacterium]
MINIIFWAIMFSVFSAVSIVLLGNREIISGNLFTFSKIVSILLDWRFIVSMIFALLTRIAFMMTNNAVLEIPKLAQSSTTITTFITIISLIFISVANYLFLEERLSLMQLFGAVIIIIGTWIMLK